MKKNILSFLMMILLLTAVMESLYSQKVRSPQAGPPGSWRLLGQVTAASGNDRDVIVVAGPYDYFRKLKFKVTNSPLTMYRMVVTYQDGFPEKIETRLEMAKGAESRVIDLNGGRRKLKTVEFWYESRGIFNGKADVTLFGMK